VSCDSNHTQSSWMTLVTAQLQPVASMLNSPLTVLLSSSNGTTNGNQVVLYPSAASTSFPSWAIAVIVVSVGCVLSAGIPQEEESTRGAPGISPAEAATDLALRAAILNDDDDEPAFHSTERFDTSACRWIQLALIRATPSSD
jgi:hypothetical protein